jgi:hypothetical protein
MNNVHFSSATPEWATPQDLFDRLNKEFKFTLDPCATKENAKCKRFYTEKDDGLSKSWKRARVFMNPPYGREIGPWVKKASEGGGNDRGVSTSGEDRHEVVSRVYLRQSGDPIFKGARKIRRQYKLGTISQHGGNFSCKMK